MTTNLTSHAGAKPAPAKPTDVDQLTQLLKTYRDATAEIYTALRVRLAKEARLFMSPSPQTYTRRVQQLEKAFELHRQAEAKIELLVAHFGGSL
jgi:hypothetical protein